MDNAVSIYALCDPDTDEVRYVGKAIDVQRRFKQHIYYSQFRQTVKDLWIQGLEKRGQQPTIVVLEVVSRGEAHAREVYWIGRCASTGRLFNITHSGISRRAARFAPRKGDRLIFGYRSKGGDEIQNPLLARVVSVDGRAIKLQAQDGSGSGDLIVLRFPEDGELALR